MKKLTKNQFKDAITFILHGAYGGYISHHEDFEVSLEDFPISTEGMDVLSRFISGVKGSLLPEIEADHYLFRITSIECFETINKTVEHCWDPYLYQFES